MNGKKAKKIRKNVYGDDSLRAERKYVKSSDGSLRGIGKRKDYQSVKRGQDDKTTPTGNDHLTTYT